MLASCEKNEEKGGSKELSPPEWIKGEWEYDGIVYKVYFKFTSNDVVFSLPYGSISSFSDLYEDGNYAIEEIKTDNSYVITVTRNQSKTISKFTKGDNDTHIQYFTIEVGVSDDIATFILNKK